MPAITNGAKLIKALADSGTGEGKLAVCREELKRIWETEKRVASSDEVIFAMEAADKEGVYGGTIAKAKSLMETGELPLAAASEPKIEDLLLGEAEPTKVAGPTDANSPPVPPEKPKTGK